MQAGTLDRRIVIQTPTRTQDGAGQPVETWTTLATVWASTDSLRGKEPFQGEQFNAQMATVFKIRWRDDVDVTARITFDGDTYNIFSVDEIGRREGLEITALALVPA